MGTIFLQLTEKFPALIPPILSQDFENLLFVVLLNDS